MCKYVWAVVCWLLFREMFAKMDTLPRLDDGFLSSRQRYLMEPPNKAHIGTKGFSLLREAVHSLEITNVL